MRSLLGTVIWSVGFSFITLSVSFHSFLAWRVSIERSAVILMEIRLCVICCFSLAAFNICSLCLIFVNLINMCLGVFHLRFVLFRTLCVSWTWVAISFPILGKFSTIISSSIFSWSFVFLFWDSYDSNVGAFNIVLEVSEIVLIYFNSFFFFPLQPSHPLSSPSPLAPNPSQHQSLFQWVNSLHEVAKVLEFQL